MDINTKEKIIRISIDLFSEKGFYETSIRDIALKCDLKPSSIYSHFSSKEEILEKIVESYKNDINKIRLSDEKLEMILNSIDPEMILIEGSKMLNQAVSSEKNNKIIKIFLLEMFKNKVISKFYMEWYFDENRKIVRKIFEKLIEKKIIKDHDPEILSNMYNTMLNFHYHEYFLLKNENKDIEFLEDKMKKQIRLFISLLK
jgi:AcrR family transcriptional regulator